MIDYWIIMIKNDYKYRLNSRKIPKGYHFIGFQHLEKLKLYFIYIFCLKRLKMLDAFFPFIYSTHKQPF